jgi:hypothetical protein
LGVLGGVKIRHLEGDPKILVSPGNGNQEEVALVIGALVRIPGEGLGGQRPFRQGVGAGVWCRTVQLCPKAAPVKSSKNWGGIVGKSCPRQEDEQNYRKKQPGHLGHSSSGLTHKRKK